MNRHAAPRPRGRRARRAEITGLTDGGGEVHGRGTAGIVALCCAGQITRASASRMSKACLGKRPRLVLVHALARIAMPCAWRGADLRTAQVSAIDQHFRERPVPV